MGGTIGCCPEDNGSLDPGPDPGPADISDDPLGPSGHRQFKGSRVNVYKQDPAVKYVGLREQWLPVDIHRGPKTRDVDIRGMSRQYGPTDNLGNYLYDPDDYPEAFDAVNTLAIIHNVLWMYRKALRKLKSRRALRWLWGDRPIHVYPRAGKKANAFYSRDDKVLMFYYFSDGTGTVYSCRSWDIVSHEAGHAILDGLKPGWLQSSHIHTPALHEAFGDITAILSVLDQLDMCEVVVARTKGQLHNPSNLLAALGEEFGEGKGLVFGIRNAHIDVKISQVVDESHELSKVFTGAVYDFLIRVFTNTLDLNMRSPAETLHKAADHVTSLFLLAILKSPDTNATFRHVADLMIQEEPRRIFKSFLRVEFGRREIFDPTARPRPRRNFISPTGDCVTCTTLSVCKSLLKPSNGEVNPKDVARNGVHRQHVTHKRRSTHNDQSLDTKDIKLTELQIFEAEPIRRRSRPVSKYENVLQAKNNNNNTDMATHEVEFRPSREVINPTDT